MRLPQLCEWLGHEGRRRRGERCGLVGDVRDAERFRGDATAIVLRIAHEHVWWPSLADSQQIVDHPRGEHGGMTAPEEHPSLESLKAVPLLDEAGVLRRRVLESR